MLDGEDKIIKNAIDGDSSAFGLLYDKYHSQIYRFIYLKVSHREEAEDITHQVFLNAWKNIEKYQIQGYPFSSWLYQISRNLVIDHYRTKKTTTDIESISESEFADSNDSLQKTIEVNFEVDIVRKAIFKLNQEQQDILIMRFVDELSSKEISTALGKPESTVRVLQHRAIKNLKNILSENK